MKHFPIFLITLALLFSSCRSLEDSTGRPTGEKQFTAIDDISTRVEDYQPVRLTTDVSLLSEKEKQMLPLLFEVADIMDEIYWLQAYGDRHQLLSRVEDEAAREYIMINYGPWDRLSLHEPFLYGYPERPAGARFYPPDMTREEFEAANLENKNSPYTLIHRDENNNLIATWYHEAYRQQYENASRLLRRAARLAEDDGLRDYFLARAEALMTSDYIRSDLAWMDMKNNTIDFIFGPIETYEDQLLGIKTAHSAYILIKDKEWSHNLERFAAFLPMLQESLPVSDEYKTEQPGTDGDLNAYDVIYYAGDANVGPKPIAVNLPNSEEVQLRKGSRRLQLKNAMQAKYDHIMVPISEILIHESQRDHVSFDAFFSNVMFHEVAHGLGIKNTITGKGTVQTALREHHSALEENKADILGLYMIENLHSLGELEGELMDHYVTYLAGIFRSVRFGAASAHGKSNMITFNFLLEHNAFSRDEESGTYQVHYEEMKSAIGELANMVLVIQGDGNYQEATRLIREKGIIPQELREDLQRINEEHVPIDIVFEQGLEVVFQ